MKGQARARRHSAMRAFCTGPLRLCALAALVAWSAAVTACRDVPPVETPPARPLEQVLYVWQRQWTPDVAAAVARAAPRSDAFMVLAGEIEKRNGAPRYVPVRVDWKALAASERPVWLVFRLRTGFLDRDGVPAFDPVPAFRETLALAREHGTAAVGLQVDYDSPTEDLAGYARFLATLRTSFPGLPLAITALPDWLSAHAFEAAVAGLDHFLLQVHSLDRPLDIQSPLVLCDTNMIFPWLAQALRLDTPCYIALPTYGYRAYFDPTGAFSGFSAEQTPSLPAEFRYRDVHADPVALSSVVHALKEERAPGLRGIAWFRLPVDSDTFNWEWATLKQVMTGEPPDAQVIAEVRSPRENLYELWVNNRGPWRPGAVQIAVSWQEGRLEAADAVNGFRLASLSDDGRTIVVGRPPHSEEAVLAAWYYITPASDAQPVTLSTPKVEIPQ